MVQGQLRRDARAGAGQAPLSLKHPEMPRCQPGGMRALPCGTQPRRYWLPLAQAAPSLTLHEIQEG